MFIQEPASNSLTSSMTAEVAPTLRFHVWSKKHVTAANVLWHKHAAVVSPRTFLVFRNRNVITEAAGETGLSPSPGFSTRCSPPSPESSQIRIQTGNPAVIAAIKVPDHQECFSIEKLKEDFLLYSQQVYTRVKAKTDTIYRCI